jgi:hypothetical protein
LFVAGLPKVDNRLASQVLRFDFGIVQDLCLKLPRFRGHRTIWVRGVHDGQDKSSLPA